MTQIAVPQPMGMTPEQIDLITRTVARGCSKDELALFFHACQRTGLDPLMKQIYAVKRWDSNLNRDVMAIQTGIDGFRLIADRTGTYAPGREPAFDYDEETKALVAATAYVKKMTQDGTWHEYSATARFDEYVALKNGKPTRFWQKMPHNQLAKCAEALAIRRGWPMELSGVYSHDEMTQADADEQAEEKHPRLRGAKAMTSTAEMTVPKTMLEVLRDESAGESREPEREVAGEAGGLVVVEGAMEVSEAAGRAGSPDAMGGHHCAIKFCSAVAMEGSPYCSQHSSSDMVGEARVRVLERKIRDLAKARGVKDEKQRDEVKQKMMDQWNIEHFRDLDLARFQKIEQWIAWKKATVPGDE